VRHGQSTWNAEHRFQGQADAPLSDLGRDQAKAVGAAVAAVVGERPVLLVTSDLGRAADTAAAVGDALATRILEFDADLREVRAGPWQGLLHPDIEAGWPETYARWRRGEDVPAGGDERPSEAGRRVAAALRRHAATAARQGRILVAVGHGASLRAAMAVGLHWPQAVRGLGNLGNVHRAEVIVSGDSEPWRLDRWNVPPG
jgi:probable phosphoglycerate mutase